jgi:hypothetical protein
VNQGQKKSALSKEAHTSMQITNFKQQSPVAWHFIQHE